GVRAVDPLRVAEARAPPADGVLEYADVVEGALGRIEGGVLPERTQAIRAAPARDTAGGVDAGAVGGIPGQGEHLLVGLPARIDPALHHLDLLKRRARVAVAARIAQREHGEVWAVAAAHGTELPPHGHAGLVAALDAVADAAAH